MSTLIKERQTPFIRDTKGIGRKQASIWPTRLSDVALGLILNAAGALVHGVLVFAAILAPVLALLAIVLLVSGMIEIASLVLSASGLHR